MIESKRRGAAKGNKNAWVWGRPDVEEAMKILDLWASEKWHKKLGNRFVLEPHAVFEVSGVRFHYLDRGLKYFRATRRRDFPASVTVPMGVAAEEMVDQVLDFLGIKREERQSLWEGLLLHLYPRTGPYRRFPGEYRTFRPRRLLYRLTGKYLERGADAFLRQIERQILLEIINAGKEPSKYISARE